MNAKLNPQFKEKMNVYLTESALDYWFNQMYYGTHGPFKRAEAGQAITFENDKASDNVNPILNKETITLIFLLFRLSSMGS